MLNQPQYRSIALFPLLQRNFLLLHQQEVHVDMQALKHEYNHQFPIHGRKIFMSHAIVHLGLGRSTTEIPHLQQIQNSPLLTHLDLLSIKQETEVHYVLFLEEHTALLQQHKIKVDHNAKNKQLL
jgi:hypothetical protein